MRTECKRKDVVSELLFGSAEPTDTHVLQSALINRQPKEHNLWLETETQSSILVYVFQTTSDILFLG